jgi:hypothetical protein
VRGIEEAKVPRERGLYVEKGPVSAKGEERGTIAGAKRGEGGGDAIFTHVRCGSSKSRNYVIIVPAGRTPATTCGAAWPPPHVSSGS